MTAPASLLFEVRWPIEDLDQTRAQLVEDALADAPDLLFDAGVQQVGPWAFTVSTDDDPPLLLGVCPVVAWTDPLARPRAS